MTTTRRAFRVVLAAATVSVAIVAGPRRAGGQELRGVVRDSASGLPLPSAVVTLLDSAANVAARTMTNERGQYHARLLGNGVRALRIVRLGFRPAEARLPEPRNGVIEVNVSMVAFSMALEAVLVTASPSCPRRPDRRLALALLEQARAGLLATVVARANKPASMKRLRSTRTLAAASDVVIHQTVRVDSAGTTFGSFAAGRTAPEFVDLGFLADSAGKNVYFGPDAEVLLDDRFARGYCFHVMDRDRARPNQVGLGFRPANRRSGRVDVDGAVWIDTVARALMDIEYRYLGVEPRMEPFRPGGRIQFLAMPNGSVVIDRWSIRIVGTDQAASDRVITASWSAARPGGADPRLNAVEVWGELARATWSDESSWKNQLGTLRLHLDHSDGRIATATTVRLEDTDYQAVSDSSGNLEIPDLVPGPYAVSIVDRDLAALGVEIPSALEFVAIRDSIMRVRLMVKDAKDYAGERCAAGVRAHQSPGDVTEGSAWLLGRVTTIDGRPVTDAKWTLRRQDSAGEQRIFRDAEVGSDGLFQYCLLRRGDDVVLYFRAKGMTDTAVNVSMRAQPTIVIVQMKPRRR